MPEILINGEKKKVACGPCIRGHRSSKCTHKDRVLIEVRKPGRPLSSCPHPAGSCSCERVVLNYTIPKSTGCPCPAGTSPSPASISRIQKTKLRKASVTAATVQKALDGDPALVAQHVSQQPGSTASDTSNVPSTTSSTSSTPRMGGMDKHVDGTNEAAAAANGIKEESSRQPPLQLGMMGVGGFGTASDEVGWSGEWPDVNAPQPMIPAPHTKASTVPGTCCQPKPAQTSSCCQPRLEMQQPQPPKAWCCSKSPQPTTNVDSFVGLNGAAANLYNANMPFDAFPFGFQPTPLNNGDFSLHDCHCGDSCQCLGCATHPRNMATMGYVGYHVGMMLQDQPGQAFPMYPPHLPHVASPFGPHGAYPYPPPLSQLPAYHQQQYLPQQIPGSMHVFDPGFAMVFNNGWQYSQGSAAFTQTPSLALDQFHTQTPPSHTGTTPAPPSPTDIFTPPSGHQRAHSDTPPNTSNVESSAQPKRNAPATAQAPGKPAVEKTGDTATPFNAESPKDDDSESALSPSSYFVQAFAVPGCSEGSCHCGDGCSCPGCLTHSGHKETAEESEKNASGQQLTSDVPITTSLDDAFSAYLTAPVSPFPTTVPG